MIVAFTGPTNLIGSQGLAVAKRLDEFEFDDDLNVWRSGCAHGVDTMAARQAAKTDGLDIELYVPYAPHNNELVEELADIARIVACGYRKDPYRRRNEVMVAGKLGIPKADLLVAFLRSEKFYRSGEWMTVNIARKADVLVEINVI